MVSLGRLRVPSSRPVVKLKYVLTLKWPRYFYSRWCPRVGGSMELDPPPPPPPWENRFPTRILQWNLHHICTGHKKSQFCKKKLNVVPFQNGGQITDFYFASFRFGQILKNNFPKECFQWNLAQRRSIWIHLHYYILFRFKMVAKTSFWYCAIMLIYAN